MARCEWKIGSHVLYSALLTLLLLALSPVTPALCDTEDLEMTESMVGEPEPPRPELKSDAYVSLQSGYRFVTPDGPTAAASPYGRLKSGVTGGYSAGTLGSDLKLSLDGMFLHGDDYHTELFLDYSGLVRFHAESGALWHNLLSEKLPPGTTDYITKDSNPDAIFGVRVATTQADTRIKLGNNPFHVNLGYWQLSRDGYEQLLFSDYMFGGASSSGPTQNTIISQASRVDRITREGRVGLDGHLGWFDLSYGFLIRDFANRAPDNRFQFANTAFGALAPGLQAHDTIPDNRLTSHTIKLYSDMSGGVVGSAAYVLTQRENNGGHGEALPSSRPADTIHTAAGDISYTPFKELSFALRYRHQQIDRDTPASLFYPFAQIPPFTAGVNTATPGVLLIRPATDTVRDSVIISSTIRPNPKMFYRLEYMADLERRDNVRDQGSFAGSPDALHSDSRQTHTGKAAFYWKPVKGLSLDAFYSYAVCDNPAYGASFSDRHTGKLLLTYTSSGKWGVTGNVLTQHENGESQASTVLPFNQTLNPPGEAKTFNLPRTSRNYSVNTSFWFSPMERLTLTTSYSLLHSYTDQTLILADISQSSIVATSFNTKANVFGIDAVYAASEQMDLSLAFQHVRSSDRFGVPANASFTTTDTTAPFTVTNYSTSGISGLANQDTTEIGVSARADWRINQLISCILDYSFRNYDSGNSAVDGSVHATMLSLKARW